MTKSKVLAALLVCAGICTRSSAQTAEIGGGVGGAHVISGGGDFYGRGLGSVTVDAHGSIPLSDRFGLEPFVTYGRRSIAPPAAAGTVVGGDTQRTEGLYGVVVTQRLRGLTRPGFHVFLSYGVAGMYGHDRTPPRQYISGRSVYNAPGFDYSEKNGLPFPVAGIGVHKSLGEHLALRIESQAITFLTIPVGVRVSAGVAVALGRTSPSSRR